MKKIFVFRNYTIEPLFNSSNEFEFHFSHYNDCHLVSSGFDMYFWFFQVPIKNDLFTLKDEILSYISWIDYLIDNIDNQSYLILCKLKVNYQIEFYHSDLSISEAISKVNLKIDDVSLINHNVVVFNIENILVNLKYPIIDWKFFYVSQMYFNPKNFSIIGDRISDFIRSLIIPRRKCIVLDMDNTLWGGILGEDGIEGIKLGNSYPGSAFLDFQQLIVESTKYGIIVAIISKNNLADVKELWENHHSLILKPEYISAYKINWLPKAENIVELASDLNIGLDSLVFIDDNPVERGLMRAAHPQVMVPEFPSQPYELRTFFMDIYNKYFIRYKLTNEDANKTQQYKERSERESARYSFIDETAYLKNLQMKLKVQIADNQSLLRISQMTQKTNQFNLTTKRYSELEIKGFVETGSLVFTLSVSDKYGDSGVTGLAIINRMGDNATIDTYLLSCRILGRSIEIAFLKYLLNRIYTDYHVRNVYAEFIRSNKNIQAEEFYDKLNFNLNEETELMKKYNLSISDTFNIEDFYQFVE
jgi:FkbH-like protein